MESIKRLNQALEYIEETLESQINDAVFSQIAACPITVFQRFFVLITGITRKEYVRLRRLSRAAGEILHTKNKLIDIALKFGYESSDAFCVAFKRAYGMTPTTARKNNAALAPYDRICFTLSITHMKEDMKMNKSENQLELVAKSYDKAIDFGRRGIDLYNDLPEHIINDPNYPIFQKMRSEGGDSDSGRKEIKEYLSPKMNMKFVDLGCCLNLMFRGYDEWPSTYYGVDISSKTIQLLGEFAAGKQLPIEALYCGSIHETPFDASFFDIAACIGVLEYFDKDFVIKAIMEAHRIIKPDGKFVLDVPDIGSPAHQITKKIEAHLGRADTYNMSSQEFEDLLQNYFGIEKKEKVGPMIQYFMICKKYS